MMHRPKLYATNQVDFVSCLALTRNAWCVGEELLVADILHSQEELEKARQELEQSRGKSSDVLVAKSSRRVAKAAKARALDLRYGKDNSGWKDGRSLLDEVQTELDKDLEKAKADSSTEALVYFHLAKAQLDSHNTDWVHRVAARESAAKALELARVIDDPRAEADALILNALCISETEGERAMKLAMDAVPIYTRLNDHRGEGIAWHFIGVGRYHGMLRQGGLRGLDESLGYFRKAQDEVCQALELFAIADLSIDYRKSRKALSAAKEALGKFQKTGYGRGWPANCQRLRLGALDLMEQSAQAQSLGQDIMEEYRREGDLKAAADVQAGVMMSLYHECRFSAAISEGEELKEFAQGVEDPHWEGNAIIWLAKINFVYRQLDQGKMLLEEARLLAQGEKDDVKEWMVLEIETRLLHEMRDYDQTFKLLDEQMELSERTGDRYRQGMSLLRRCLVWGQKETPTSSDSKNSMRAAVEAKDIFKELGDKGGEASSWDKIAQSHIIHLDDKLSDPEEALAAAETCRKLHQKKGDREREAKMMLRVMCRIHTDMGNHVEAIKVAEEAVRLVRRSSHQDKALLADCLTYLVRLREEQLLPPEEDEFDPRTQAKKKPILDGKNAERARRKCHSEAKEAYVCARDAEDKQLQASLALNLASVEFRIIGNNEKAAEFVSKAAAYAVDCHDSSLQAMAALLEAEMLFMRETPDIQGATQAASKALALAQTNGDEETAANVFYFMESMEEAAEEEWGPEHYNKKPRADEKAKPTPTVRRKRPAGSEEMLYDVKLGKLHGSRVDKESLMKIVAETAIANAGLDNIDYDTPLVDSGMDSLQGVALRNQLQSLTNMTLPASFTYDNPTQRSIVGCLIQRSKEGARVR